MSKLYSGSDLLQRLQITTTLVKWKRCDCSPVRITVQQAIAIVRAGEYVGEGSQSRVHTIRELPPAHPRGVRVECFRNQEAAVLPPSPEWLRAHGGYRSKVSRVEVS